MIQHTNKTLGSFFSHRAHRVHGAFWRTVSSPQKAFGIQRTQSVTAKIACKVCDSLCLNGPLWELDSVRGNVPHDKRKSLRDTNKGYGKERRNTQQISRNCKIISVTTPS